MAFSLRGVHVPHRKNTADVPAAQMPVPKTVTLPVSMHIGAPAVPIVKVGDEVKVGTLIAEQNGPVSSPVYASVSGTVTKIEDFLLSSGNTAPAIVIESDGKMEADPALCPPVVENREQFIEAVRKSGLVGLGGAGFPTYFKLNADPARIEELIVNGAECEPYITSDTRIMLERTHEIATGLKALQKYLGVKRIIIGIENNKKPAIEAMQKMAGGMTGVEVKVLPALYPQGGEKVLIYHTTGKKVPTGKLPIDVGVIVCNSTTVASIGRYLETGMPLVEKLVTVDGGAVKEPKNIWVPIGTSMEDVFTFCGGFASDPFKVLYGGPMMGIAVPDLAEPILKNTNAILALTEKEAREPKTTNCIRCGACMNHCPFGINPAAIALAQHQEDIDTLDKLGVDACMECGCCAFICPANRPLVQTNKLAKALLREARAKAKEEKK